jgi:hypothetical protein
MPQPLGHGLGFVPRHLLERAGKHRGLAGEGGLRGRDRSDCRRVMALLLFSLRKIEFVLAKMEVSG